LEVTVNVQECAATFEASLIDKDELTSTTTPSSLSVNCNSHIKTE